MKSEEQFINFQDYFKNYKDRGMKIVFFNRPKARQFDYKPRYYDAEKERRAQRKKELGFGDEGTTKRAMFKGELKSRWRSDNKVENERKRRRSIIYIAFIAVVIYYLFFTDFIQKIVSLITAI